MHDINHRVNASTRVWHPCQCPPGPVCIRIRDGACMMQHVSLLSLPARQDQASKLDASYSYIISVSPKYDLRVRNTANTALSNREKLGVDQVFVV